ncbi:MAG UNVERIFIED_CONTAM: DegT/DnrJ/EryC1/StrS family aminotransferase [Anaerolineae bacterium]
MKQGDEVMTSTLTFIGTVNPIFYLGATPIFIDSETTSWNMHPTYLKSLRERAKANRLPSAVIVVHLYGQCANMKAISDLCQQMESRCWRMLQKHWAQRMKAISRNAFKDRDLFIQRKQDHHDFGWRHDGFG